MNTLYERLGGEAAVDAAVDKFYGKVLVDARIKHFFDGLDMDRQRRHMKVFMGYAFGGIPSYSGKSMRDTHRRLVEDMALSDSHFDAVMENLGDTLKELGVAHELIAEAATIVEATRDDVLNR